MATKIIKIISFCIAFVLGLVSILAEKKYYNEPKIIVDLIPIIFTTLVVIIAIMEFTNFYEIIKKWRVGKINFEEVCTKIGNRCNCKILFCNAKPHPILELPYGNCEKVITISNENISEILKLSVKSVDSEVKLYCRENNKIEIKVVKVKANGTFTVDLEFELKPDFEYCDGINYSSEQLLLCRKK